MTSMSTSSLHSSLKWLKGRRAWVKQMLQSVFPAFHVVDLRESKQKTNWRAENSTLPNVRRSKFRNILHWAYYPFCHISHISFILIFSVYQILWNHKGLILKDKLFLQLKKQNSWFHMASLLKYCFSKKHTLMFYWNVSSLQLTNLKALFLKSMGYFLT